MNGSVSEPSVRSRLRETRTARGLSQEELGRRAGISRQAVSAVEAGRTVPGTAVALRLARALRCGVEDLFQIEDPAPEGPVHAATPVASDGTRTLLGRVGDRIVAHPLSTGRAVAEGFVAADGLLRHTEDGGWDARFLVPSDQVDRTAFLLGCDPSLSLVAARFARRTDTERLHCLQTPSRTALHGVKHGTAHVAGCHLRGSDGEYNVEFAAEALASDGGMLVTLASWEQGLALRRGNPLAVRSVSDLAHPDVRIVNRPPGAGARQLLDDALAEAGVEPSLVPGYDLELPSHLAVASAVATGTADAGITLRAAAETFGLDFLPLQPVRFDLLVPRAAEAHPSVEALLNLLTSRALREELSALPGYDATETGTVVARFEPEA